MPRKTKKRSSRKRTGRRLKKRSGEGFAKMNYQSGEFTRAALAAALIGATGKSKTKTKPNDDASEGAQNELIARSTFSKWNKQPKIIKKLRPLISRALWEGAIGFSLNSTIAVNTLNKQVVGEIARIWGGPDIQDLFLRASAINATWAALAPGLGSTQRTGRIFLESCKIGVEFTNMQPAASFATLYVLRCKQDLNAAADIDSATSWETAIDETAGSLGSTTASNTMPDVTPRKLKPFMHEYTIVHEKTWGLNPGEVRRHDVTIGLNKFVDYSQTMGNFRIHGITHAFLLVARGTPCDTVTTQGAATGTIQFSPTKIVGWYSTKYVTKWVPNAPDSNFQSNSISGAVQANLYTLNDDSSAVINMMTTPVG